jgi:choloylglycine hydrolase
MNYPLATLFLLALGSTTAMACTGISLKSTDGAVITARTVEWALGDAAHDVVVAFPRTQSYTGLTPDGENGLRWTGKHGLMDRTMDQTE